MEKTDNSGFQDVLEEMPRKSKRPKRSTNLTALVGEWTKYDSPAQFLPATEGADHGLMKISSSIFFNFLMRGDRVINNIFDSQ